MNIHFIGVGKMGLPMACHFLKAGHVMSVSDADPKRLALATAKGLTVAEAAKAMAAAEIIFSSLPQDAALFTVATQVAVSARKGATFVDTSTVSQQASSEVAVLLQGTGIGYLRTTVSGNNHMAEAALLTVMASGPRSSYDTLLPVLKLLGPHQFYLGEGEEARLMKLVVNLMIAQTSAMLSEGLALGRKGGLAWQDMWQVLCASAVASPILKAKAVQLSQRDFSPTFTVVQMVKDLALILAAGQEVHTPLPQTAMTLQLMQAAMAQGDALEDYAAIIKTVERSAGLDTDLNSLKN